MYKKRYVSLKLHKDLKLIYSEKATRLKNLPVFFSNFLGFLENLNFKAGVNLLSHGFQVVSNFKANFQIHVLFKFFWNNFYD